MNLVISQQLAQATVDYLVKRPYGEVAGLIQQLTRLMPHDAKPAAPTTPPEAQTGSDNGASAEESEKTPEKEG